MSVSLDFSGNSSMNHEKVDAYLYFLYIFFITLALEVTRMTIKAELMLPIKLLKEASILMRKLMLTTPVEEILLEARKWGILALVERKLSETGALEKICKARNHDVFITLDIRNYLL